MTTTAITTAITGRIDTITAIYVESFRSTYAAVESWKASHRGQSPFNTSGMTHLARIASMVTSYINGMPGTGYLDNDKVARRAAEQAAILCANYAAKVEAKAAGMTEITVSTMDASGAFVITGTKAGQAVEIRQSMITNVSSKGTWFHQFPALVYVAGRKSTEKALKAL